jgi:hypothetical protein
MVAGEKAYMKLHTQSGEHYYSSDRRKDDRDLMNVIYNSINKFNWEDFDIKDKQTKINLTAAILSDIKIWKDSNIS